MKVALWFDPESGEAEKALGEVGPSEAHWKVIRDGDAISILARNAKSRVVLIASGTWSGKGIGQRQEIGETVTDRQWGLLTNAIARAERDDEPPVRAPPARPLVELTGPEGVLPGAHASTITSEPAPGPKDGRSGWWAFGAAVVALIGFVVAWRAEQPGDPSGRSITIVLGVLAGGLWIYALYGGATACPSCHAWFKRQQTSKEELGTSTENRQVSTPVKDASGNTIGSTTQTVAYQVTRYHYHYVCKACRHRWVRSGSSSSRL